MEATAACCFLGKGVEEIHHAHASEFTHLVKGLIEFLRKHYALFLIDDCLVHPVNLVSDDVD
jgi:hypothetical protein